ncbi:MAG: c-type cytochrome, partial [Bdellovibrionales bacterium]|nr:c-type cytochrome [Bdellovibrionales bacterium]
LTAKVGETIRLFVGNGGPNLVSSFHVIGEIFDAVHVEGGSLVNENVQTTLIPSGGAAMVEFKVDVPGTLVIVDHSIFRAFNKGALGMINVEGDENKQIYSGTIEEGIYLPEGGGIQSMPGDSKPMEVVAAKSREEKIKFGKEIYMQTCFACHQGEGQGIPNAFPPLAKSDFLNGSIKASISAVKNGLSGKLKVNGKEYNGVMPSLGLSDDEIANVLTYVYNSWGNSGKVVTSSEVRAVQKAAH